MKSTLVTLGVALGLLAGSTASAQTLRYAADAEGPHRYLRTQKDHVVQTVNGAEQVSDIESYWRFATTVESGADGLVVSVVHDSVSIQAPGPTAPDFSALYDTPVRIRMSDRGEVEEVVVADSLPEGLERLDLETTYGSFYPVLPPGETSPGTTWADTTEVHTNQNGLDVTVMRVNTYTVGGEETVAGRDAVAVDFDTVFEIEGTGNQGGAEISLSGTGEGGGRYFVQRDPGIFLGGTESAEMTLDAFVAAGGQNLLIPIVQTREETIEYVE